MKGKIFNEYEKMLDEHYDNMSDADIMREHPSMCYKCPELFEAYSTILNEKLNGDIVDKEFNDDSGFYGGLYKGKKFPAGYSTHNFGKQIENKDELEMNHKYNIYLETIDMWVMGYRLKPAGIGLYKFKLDNKSETAKFNIKKLYNNIKKAYIIQYSN